MAKNDVKSRVSKDLYKSPEDSDFPSWMKKLTLGMPYFVQSCTKDWTGRLVSIDGPYTVTLEDASWVAESGRLHEFIEKGEAANMEVEYVGVVCVQWVDWIPFPHQLPLLTK